MFGGFRATARRLVNWFGLDKSKLPNPFDEAVEKFVAPGGGAEKVDLSGSRVSGARKLMPLQRLGAPIRKVTILYVPQVSSVCSGVDGNFSSDVDGKAVHQSHFNREDKRWVVRAEVEGKDRTAMCHVFATGEGTTKKGEDPA